MGCIWHSAFRSIHNPGVILSGRNRGAGGRNTAPEVRRATLLNVNGLRIERSNACLIRRPHVQTGTSSATRAPAGDKCQKLVTVAVNTKSRMVQLGNLPRHFWFIQITGKVQLPSVAGNDFSLRAAVGAESTCEGC